MLTYYSDGYCQSFHEVKKTSGGFTSEQECYDKIMDDNITECAIGSGLKIAIGKEGGGFAGRCVCQKSGTTCVVTTKNAVGANGLDLWVCQSANCRSKNFVFISTSMFDC